MVCGCSAGDVAEIQGFYCEYSTSYRCTTAHGLKYLLVLADFLHYKPRIC